MPEIHIGEKTVCWCKFSTHRIMRLNPLSISLCKNNVQMDEGLQCEALKLQVKR